MVQNYSKSPINVVWLQCARIFSGWVKLKMKNIIKTKVGNIAFKSFVGAGALVMVTLASAWGTYKILTEG